MLQSSDEFNIETMLVTWALGNVEDSSEVSGLVSWGRFNRHIHTHSRFDLSFGGLREIGIKWVAVLSVYIHEKRSEISHESRYIIFTGGLGQGLSATHF
jgi:hypothetical protein